MNTFGLTVRRVHVSCGELAYVDEGNGPPILLLHGAPFTSLGFVSAQPSTTSDSGFVKSQGGKFTLDGK